MDELNIVSGVLKQDKQYLFDNRLEKEIEEIKTEKERLDNEVQKYDNIKAILECLPNELGWQFPLLPVTKHAFFPGAVLTNTNEIQVHIGDGWFTRCSAHHAVGICHRRQEKCRETKRLLEERETLLLSWLHAAQGKSGIAGGYERDEEEEIGPDDAFTADEIVEYITEEQYIADKEVHKERAREHYLKQRAIAVEKEEKEKSISDLWARLEELEMEEEGSGELRKVMEETSENVAKSKTGENSPAKNEGKVNFAEAAKIRIGWDWNDGSESEESSDTVSSDHSREENKERPHKLSFAEHIETGSDETSVIEFAHTPVDSIPPASPAGVLTSPSDIYNSYQELFAAKTTPKSILKRRSTEESAEEWPSLSYPMREESDFSSNEKLYEPSQQVINDIVEKQDAKVVQFDTQTLDKKISKFKSARMASKKSK